MAYDFVRASSQYLMVGSSVVTGPPFTMAAFVYPNNATQLMTATLVGSFASFTCAAAVALSGHVAGDPVSYTTKGDTGSNFLNAQTTAAFSASAWNAVSGVSESVSSRFAYLDGGNKGSNTTTDNAMTLNRTSVGAGIYNNLLYDYFDGNICEVAYWNVALTDAEIASLAKGFKPTRIRPQSLMFYAPLLRNLQDVKGGLTITNNNSATVANHPRVY